MKPLNIKEIAYAVDGHIIGSTEDILIESVKTNSKEEVLNSLFVPIVGERVDAHNFIADAKEHGSVACFISHDVDTLDGMVYVRVENTLDALQKLGSYYRDKFTIPVIGITGSVGKTTTKEMVSAALETKYKVLKTIGNMNSQVGLPLMMFHIEDEHEIAVIEMGISEFGEMERLTKVSKPNTAIMTNIGISHIAQLKTRENIRKEKANIINAFNENSVLYLCGDDDLLNELYQEKHNKNTETSKKCDMIELSEETRTSLAKGDVIAFGLSGDFEYLANNIRVEDGKTYFTVRIQKDGQIEEETIILNVLGNHNVSNALVALAIANQYGIPTSIAKVGLEGYSPIAMRGQIKKNNGITVIDDSYNASPDSMKSGVGVLVSLPEVTRRIAVLADVKELGEVSKEGHYGVGVYISNMNIDMVVTIGEEAKYIADGITDNTDRIKTISLHNNEEAISYLKEVLHEGDGVLVKGSRGMATEVIVKALCN